jgi:hypothetical protein
MGLARHEIKGREVGQVIMIAQFLGADVIGQSAMPGRRRSGIKLIGWQREMNCSDR